MDQDQDDVAMVYKAFSSRNRKRGHHESSLETPYELQLKRSKEELGEERSKESVPEDVGREGPSSYEHEDGEEVCVEQMVSDHGEAEKICDVARNNNLPYPIGPHPPPPVPPPNQLRRQREDMLWLYSLAILDRNYSKAELRAQHLLASANRGLQALVTARDVEHFLNNLFEGYSLSISYRCQWPGHNTVLSTESEVCVDCRRGVNCLRGTRGERLRVVTVEVRRQIEEILKRQLPAIIEYHYAAHTGRGEVDYSVRESPSFRSSMEDSAEFRSGRIVVQLAVNGDGFKVKSNTTGGLWPFYAQFLDLDRTSRQKPMNSLFLGMLSFGGTNKVDDTKLEELSSSVLGEIIGMNGFTLPVVDDQMNQWLVRVIVTTSILDTEANCKLHGLRNWARTDQPCCQYCLQQGVRDRNRQSTSFTGVSGVRRTPWSAYNAAVNGSDGFIGYTIMHSVTSPVSGTVDLLHIGDLGWKKDVEVGMRGDSNNRLIRLPVAVREELNKISDEARLPTYHPVRIRLFTSGAKSGRETRLSLFTHGCIALSTFSPGLLRGRSAYDLEASAVASCYFFVQTLNFRRLLDDIVTQTTIQDVAVKIALLGSLQEECIGRCTYKMHVYNSHVPHQLLERGNIATCDSASFEHLHLFLRKCLSSFNTKTYESSMLRRALLKEVVASECGYRSVDTSLQELKEYMVIRDRTRIVIDEHLLNCNVPKGAEMIIDWQDIRRDYRLYGLQGCVRYFRRLIVGGMHLSSHEDDIGFPMPVKTQQNLVTVFQLGSAHVGKILSMGVNAAGIVVCYLQCYELDGSLGETLLQSIGQSRAAQQLRHLFNQVVLGNPYFMKKLFGGRVYNNCCTHEQIVGTTVEMNFFNEVYFCTMPRKN